MVAKKKNIHNNEEGQAIFEFIVFMPLLLVLITTLITTGNAINASINQQKATRGYFFNIIQNNSRIPSKDNLRQLRDAGLNTVSVFSIGWRKEEQGGNKSMAACTRYTTMFGDITDSETCEEPITDDNKSQFIRVFTFFGVCGESYGIIDGSGLQRVDWLRKRFDICTLEP